MQVLHLFQEYLPLSEMWAYNLLKAFDRSEVAIGALYYNQNNKFFDSDFKFVDRSDSPLIYQLFQKPKELGYFSHKLAKLRWKLQRKDVLDIESWIEKENPAILHFHFATTAVLFKKLWKDSRTPFVVSFYGYDYEKAIYDNRRLIEEYRVIFDKATALFVEGEHGKKILRDLGCEEDKIKIVKLGVADTRETNIIDHRDDRLKLVQIANFVEKKGQEMIVRAVQMNRDKWDQKVHITFVGDSNTTYGRKVINLIKKHQLDPFFSFVEFMSYEEIPKYLSEFDVFIHPSQYSVDCDCEGGAPTILLDAQSAGLPIISTTHCDIPSYVLHSKTGLLSAEKDVENLAASIEFFRKCSSKEYLEYAHSARAHVHENYNIRRNAIILESKYEEIRASR